MKESSKDHSLLKTHKISKKEIKNEDRVKHNNSYSKKVIRKWVSRVIQNNITQRATKK